MNSRDNPTDLGNWWGLEQGERCIAELREVQAPIKIGCFSRPGDGLDDSDVFLPSYKVSVQNAEMFF